MILYVGGLVNNTFKDHLPQQYRERLLAGDHALTPSGKIQKQSVATACSLDFDYMELSIPRINHRRLSKVQHFKCYHSTEDDVCWEREPDCSDGSGYGNCNSISKSEPLICPSFLNTAIRAVILLTACLCCPYASSNAMCGAQTSNSLVATHPLTPRTMSILYNAKERVNHKKRTGVLSPHASPLDSHTEKGNPPYPLLCNYSNLYPDLPGENSRKACRLRPGPYSERMIVSSTVTSIWSVGLISIDRFLYILYGLHYQRWLTPLRARWLISFTWLLGLLVGFLPALGWRGNTNNGKVCWFIRLAPPGLVVLTAAIGFLPVLATSVLYSIILYHALQKVKQLQHADKNSGCAVASVGTGPAMRLNRGTSAATNTDHDQKSSPKKWKAIKVVLFTNGSFVLTWVPYFIACCLYVACEATSQHVDSCKSLRVAIGAPLAIMGFLNSLLNPVIYAWWHNGFRTFVRKTLCKQCGKKQSLTPVSNSKTTSRTTTGSATSSTKTTGTSSTKSSQSREAMPILEEHTEF
ncbi:hypothetical protein PR048_017321 [Dryococelus australis]|uniref:G-protein coupled receptors family 1 profile domain-containing protein n=1 Tax=Dryococelus australis TaxID=614101 RepID=A0ABQ9H972_9NEOP|nr:hypothetical protein PR048_017321 [Dryococelus australis]